MKAKTKAVGGNPVGAGAVDFTNFLRQGLTGGSFAGQQLPWQQNAFGQTMGMGGAIDKLLAGNVGDPLSLTNYFKQGNGMASFNPASLNFQSPSFGLTNFQTPNAIAPNFQAPNFVNPNVNPAALDFNTAFSQINANNPFSLGDLRSVMADEANRQILAQNASLQGTGTGFMSSGKALGEELLRRDLPARLGLAASQIGDSRINQALNLAGMGANVGLENNQLMANIANMQNQFQQGNAQFGAGLNLQAQGMNADIMNQLNQLNLNQGLAQNQFNQGNAQFGASNDLNAQIANIQSMLQNQGMGNQYSLGLGNMFQGFQQNQLGAQQNMLGMLFNAFNQLNALGTPQAQMVQQKSPFEQITGAIGNIAGAAAPFFMGGFSMPNFGGGMPNLGNMPQIGSTPFMMPNTPFPLIPQSYLPPIPGR